MNQAIQADESRPIDWSSKLRAVAIHFLLSLVAFLIVAYLILTRWYPDFHFFIDGGWQGVRILVAVDLVLGPLLMLLIFDARKTRRAILFDLGCIAVIQISAMAWGIHAIHSQRIGAMAFKDNALFVVYAEDLLAQGADLDELAGYSDGHPPLVFVRPPDLVSGELQRSFEKLDLPREAHAHLYQPWAEGFARARERGNFDVLRASEDFPAFGAEVEAYFTDSGRSTEDTTFMVYYGRYGRRMLAFDRDSGELLAALSYYDPAQAREAVPII